MNPSITLMELRMDLYNIQQFLLITPPGYKRDQLDAALKRVWARWDQVHQQGA